MINTKTSGKNFTFTGYVEKRNYSKNYSYNRILLRNVRIGKLLFREHVWIKESKFLKTIVNGTIIKFSGTICEYINPEDLNRPKKGIQKVRRIETIKKIKVGKFLLRSNHYEKHSWED